MHVAGGPAVGDVNQDDRRFAKRRELAHVFDDRRIVRRVFQRYEDACVHHASHPWNVCTRSHALSAAITMATVHASTLTHLALTNGPIFRRSDVNITSGNTAKESCKLRITWLRMSSFAVPLSP